MRATRTHGWSRCSVWQFAVIVVAIMPVLVVYPFVQKYFVRGALIEGRRSRDVKVLSLRPCPGGSVKRQPELTPLGQGEDSYMNPGLPLTISTVIIKGI